MAAVSNIFTYKPKHVYPNAVIIENSKAVKEDGSYFKKMHHISEKQISYSQSKREADLRFAELFKGYSNALRSHDPNSILAKACEFTGTYLSQIESKQSKLDAFVSNSFVAPLMTFVRGDISLALEAKSQYDRALQGYDQQITTLEELKKKEKKKVAGEPKGKGLQKAEQDLFLLKQTFEQADLDARNKLQDTRSKNAFQSLEYVCNLANAYVDFFTEGLECMRVFQEQLQDFRNSYEKSREEYLSTQLKRPQVMVVKPKQQKRAVYGVDIQEVWNSENVPPDKLPPFLNSIFTTLFAKSLKLEGIFRLSANKEEVKAFKVSIDQGNLPDFSTVDDPHVISNLLSVWLRELPAPLCTLALYERFLAVQASKDNHKAYIHMLSNTIKQLPGPNKTVLQHLLHLLANIAVFSETNKMTPSNLAIVFGPTILYGAKADAMTFAVVNGVVESMIQFYEELFGEPISTDKYGVRPKRPDRPMSIMPRAGAAGFPKTPPPERPGSQFGGAPILPNDIAAAAAAAAAERPNRPPSLMDNASPKLTRPPSQFGLLSMPALKSKPPVEKVDKPERPSSLWQAPAAPQASPLKKASLLSRANSNDAGLRRASVDAQDTTQQPATSTPREDSVLASVAPTEEATKEASTPATEVPTTTTLPTTTVSAPSKPSRPPPPSRSDRPVLAETGSGTNLAALLKRSDSNPGAAPMPSPTTADSAVSAAARERPPRPQRPPSVSPRSMSISDDAPPSGLGAKRPDFPPPVAPTSTSFAARRSVSVADVHEAKALAFQNSQLVGSSSAPPVSPLPPFKSQSQTTETISPPTSSHEHDYKDYEGEQWDEGGDEQFVEVEYDLDEYQGEYQYEGGEEDYGDAYYDENNQEHYDEGGEHQE